MAKITYTGESENISWHGVAMARGKAVETDNAALIKAAGGHPLFDVSGVEAEADTPFSRGATAATTGKGRSVPPAYRGKSEAEEWVKGFDSVKPNE